jgi:hypothetical protein
MKLIGNQLRKRMEDIRLAREAEIFRVEEEKIQTALALKREQELAEKLRVAKLLELKLGFEQELLKTMSYWKNMINRNLTSPIYLSEIIEIYEYLSHMEDIKREPILFETISYMLEVLTNPEANLQDATPYNEIFDKDDAIYSLKFLTIQHWDEQVFVKVSLRLMNKCNLTQLSTFLSILSTELLRRNSIMEEIYFSNLYIPNLSSISITSVDEW